MLVEFLGYANEWSQAAFNRAKGKMSCIPSLEDILKEWCPIYSKYRFTLDDGRIIEDIVIHVKKNEK